MAKVATKKVSGKEEKSENGKVQEEETLVEVEETPVEEVDEIAEAQENFDVLVPLAENKTWKLGTEDDNSRTYTQKPLSFFRKAELYALCGGVLRQAMLTSGEGSLGDVLGIGGGERGNILSNLDMRDAESFIALAASVAAYVPDFLENSYCIVLAVPRHEREWAAQMMQNGREDGGFDDEDGVSIINTFIVQNWEAIMRFFGEDVQGIAATAQKMRAKKNQTKKSQDE